MTRDELETKCACLMKENEELRWQLEETKKDYLYALHLLLPYLIAERDAKRVSAQDRR